MISILNISNCLKCLLYKPLRIVIHRTYVRKCSKHANKAFTIEDDTIDDFTSQLLQKKIDKWDSHKLKLNNNKSLPQCKCQEMIPFNVNTVDVHFQEALEICDNDLVIDLIEKCIKHKICPTLSNLNCVLSLCSQNGNLTAITDLMKHYEEVQPNVLLANAHFNHYMAQAMFIRGNIDASLKLFNKIYTEYPFIRRRIRLILKYLIDVELSNRSEAAMMNLVKFSEELVKKYSDFFPLSCIWQSCFLSEWHTDQNLSLELLHKNEGLLSAIISRIPYVVSSSLRSNKTEVVYRLLEVLIKYEMRAQYREILLSLLDYQIHYGDIQSCLEIIRWSLKHNVQLTPLQNEKFLNILLSSGSADVNTIEKSSITNKKLKVTPVFKF